MGNPCSPQTQKRTSGPEFSGTLTRLDNAWRGETRFRLLLLSIILVICLLMGNFALPGSHLALWDNSEHPRERAGGTAGLTGLLLALLRIWPEVRRCRLRIAELQNSAHRVQYFWDRHAGGLKVSEQEWENVFVAAQSLLEVTGHARDTNRHPLLEMLVRILHLGEPRGESQLPTPSM